MTTSGAKTIDLRSILIEKRYRCMSRAYASVTQCFFTESYPMLFPIFPSYHALGDNSDCLRKIAIFSKFEFWWPLVTSILTWPENDIVKSLRSRRGLSYAFYRLSLSGVVFEFDFFFHLTASGTKTIDLRSNLIGKQSLLSARNGTFQRPPGIGLKSRSSKVTRSRNGQTESFGWYSFYAISLSRTRKTILENFLNSPNRTKKENWKK